MTSRRAVPERGPHRRISTRVFTACALGFALLVACGLSIWASSQPDGLEFVAESLGFLSAAEDGALSAAPLADYGVAAIEQPWVSVAVAGAIGCAVTFGVSWVIGRVVRSRADRT
ncbi:hypothetical protein F6J84_10210 [Microbacterium caowuchunii]|uniref:PDGLE domain-containing protein n=1 Tax=Microbacterium caowuchunii TaxID=2614638 RepID=UPI0012476026|nr:PDGLE domain-containing protein [Microbacterium caowuchunii]QEW00428.1 hypothetical protein F6J84_10210 [Microbacterium caowuchunii]